MDQETGFKIKIDLWIRDAVIGKVCQIGVGYLYDIKEHGDAELATRRINQFADYIELWGAEADRCMKEEAQKIAGLEFESSKGREEIGRGMG